MAETQLLRIRIKPGRTDQVIAFIRTLLERRDEALEALRREGMLVESLFLERQEHADYLYYYVKSRSLARASALHAQSRDGLTAEVERFMAETWGEIASPEPLLDLDLLPSDLPAPGDRSTVASADRSTVAPG